MPPTDTTPADDGDLTPTQALLQGLIDYAGLFPPARLAMPDAVRTYAEHLRSPHAWMLGRFICPVSRLEEFRAASASLLPREPSSRPLQHAAHGRNVADMPPLSPDTHAHHADQPWPISAIIDGDLDEDLDAVFAFNQEHADARKGAAIIDAVEIKAPTDPGAASIFIDEALDLLPEEVYPFFEIAVLPDAATPSASAPDVRGPIAALSGADAGAKIRTGGITPDAFPSPESVAAFLVACAAADVPFKATAGLHHPVRSEYPLTYEPNCARAVMHGFLNLFIAAALVRVHRLDIPAATTILTETSVRAFEFSGRAIRWRNLTLEDAQIAVVRETFALSYGSCSFGEPVEDLIKLGIL